MSDVLFSLVFPVLGTILSNVMLSSSLLVVRLSRRQRFLSKSVNPIPWAMGMVTSYVWLIYGVMIGDYFIVSAKVFGVFVTTFATTSAMTLLAASRDPQEWKYIGYMEAIIMMSIAVWLVIAYVIISTGDLDLGAFLISIYAVATTILMYIAPMLNLVTVITLRDASSIYLPQAIATSLNSLCWLVYGLFGVQSPTIYVSSSMGLFSSISMISLKIIFPSKVVLESTALLAAAESKAAMAATLSSTATAGSHGDNGSSINRTMASTPEAPSEAQAEARRKVSIDNGNNQYVRVRHESNASNSSIPSSTTEGGEAHHTAGATFYPVRRATIDQGRPRHGSTASINGSSGNYIGSIVRSAEATGGLRSRAPSSASGRSGHSGGTASAAVEGDYRNRSCSYYRRGDMSSVPFRDPHEQQQQQQQYSAQEQHIVTRGRTATMKSVIAPEAPPSITDYLASTLDYTLEAMRLRAESVLQVVESTILTTAAPLLREEVVEAAANLQELQAIEEQCTESDLNGLHPSTVTDEVFRERDHLVVGTPDHYYTPNGDIQSSCAPSSTATPTAAGADPSATIAMPLILRPELQPGATTNTFSTASPSITAGTSTGEQTISSGTTLGTFDAIVEEKDEDINGDDAV